jgi:inhibitor of cysteine peptidase
MKKKENARSMIRSAVAIGLVVLTLCGIIASQASQPHASQTKGASPIIIVTDADNGKDIDLPAGDELVVRLKSNPSTGYSWAIKGDPSPLRLVKSSTKRSGQTGQAAGTPVTQEFRLTSTSAGMASLTLEYRRPWEYTAGPARKFHLQVNAR